MSIGERERQTLESIENGLVRSAPKLASMLAIFTRLAANEKMPARRPVRRASSLRTGGGVTAGPRALGRSGRLRPRLGQAAQRWLWLAIAVALLALTVILGHGTGRAACTAATRVAATCHHVPAPARPVANRPGGS